MLKNSIFLSLILRINFLFFLTSVFFIFIIFSKSDAFSKDSLNSLYPFYVISFRYYDYNLASNVEYFLFNDFQQVVDYNKNRVYLFSLDKNVLPIINELYNLKGKRFPVYYYPPIPKEKLSNKKVLKGTSFGTIAYLKKYKDLESQNSDLNKDDLNKDIFLGPDLQVMYLYDYATPNFYRYIDPNLASILYPIEDNIKVLINRIIVFSITNSSIMSSSNTQFDNIQSNNNRSNSFNNQSNNQDNLIIGYKDYTDYLNYLKAFNNLNKPEITLYEALFFKGNFYFKFLDTKKNIVTIYSINEYKIYKELGSYSFKDVEFFEF